MNTKNGYGYATDRMIDSLTRLGHTIKANDPTAPVEIWFDQPHHWKWRDHQYKIGYHPWESTKLQDGWVEAMNKCDEIWTPSELIGRWYADDGVTRPIYVYEHGVDSVWAPKKYHLNKIKYDKIRFLHIGAEAARKGGWDALRAFRLAFQTKDDVEFTMKLIGVNFTIERVGKINIINRKMSLEELIGLYHAHDVYMYPSAGEGFGLTPLQAMATGMPTITVPDWAPYRRFLDPNLTLPARLVNSPWPEVHPGKVFRVSQDDMIDRMRWAYDNFDAAKDFADKQIEPIKADYNWDLLTKEMFDNLQKRLKNLSL